MPTCREVIVKTYNHTTGGSKHAIWARPVKGQSLDENMFVECSSAMRKKHAVDKYFKIQAAIKNKEGGNDFLYTSPRWPYEVLTEDEVRGFIGQ